ncbi:hypothetical protein CDL15_Pgr020823 [Punica granatum]|uniref:Uncharacterized protein n=1 Tax=Punica granatum TaxID=22663 RepID=A0A218XW90_PUNGR|nr:hypothetical protein CDL15_Pgr020823 [Punica granatum]
MIKTDLEKGLILGKWLPLRRLKLLIQNRGQCPKTLSTQNLKEVLFLSQCLSLRNLLTTHPLVLPQRLRLLRNLMQIPRGLKKLIQFLSQRASKIVDIPDYARFGKVKKLLKNASKFYVDYHPEIVGG